MQIQKYLAGAALFSAALVSLSCKYDRRELGPAPDASFTVTPIQGQTNRFLLKSTSTNAFMYDWDKGAGFVRGGETDTVYYPDAGSYRVRLFAYGHSGIDTASQMINVAQNDPAAQTPEKILTGNSTKKWRLAPEAGALWIGDAGSTFWQNSDADLAPRACLFNDEYTFTLAGRMFSRDGKGDFYVDEEGGAAHPAGMPSSGCHPNGDIPSQFSAWANNANFTFDVINNNKLRVNGTGAYLGLYKAGTTEAAVPAPQGSVTYDIVSLTPTRMVLKIDYGWGAWRFTFVPAP